ncbi:response regulator transcription factor [Xylocopilactobacillus apis]|uniref:DNA-binding response regulator n=1 Tax=Xylocopilactobacillus apis TaxID=2932183 RepID=A0AAU9D0N8_9LACO|nr:response regulator transcription factor [Xylocopilactobacillus apis]BDR57118.1 DNA-binding response regulator [Xylocopilactobacillus apis]
MEKILVVDDEPSILRLLKTSLEKDGYLVDTAQSLASLNFNQLSSYNLMILDVMMPGISGFEFVQKHREELDCPIIFLTAKNQEADILLGLGLGADDYIVKPFRSRELRARVKAHLRREERPHRHVFKAGDFTFDLNKKVMFYRNQKVSLTKGEYAICEFLAKNKGFVFSKDQIYEQVFGIESDGDSNSIVTHIKNIRQKLSVQNCPIQTSWGVGYLWQSGN